MNRHGNTLVGLFYFDGTRPLWTYTVARNWFFSPSMPTKNFGAALYEMSFHKYRLLGNCTNWIKLPPGYSLSTHYQSLKSACDSIFTAKGYNLADYQNVFYLFSSVEFTEVYGPNWMFVSDIKGVHGAASTPEYTLALYLHIWYHAHDNDFYIRGCEGSALGYATKVLGSQRVGPGTPPGKYPVFVRYGDCYDSSGSNAYLHGYCLPKRVDWQWFPVFAKTGGGVPYVTDVTTLGSGTYKIKPLSFKGAPPDGCKGLRITRQTTPEHTQYYFFEYRYPVGVDSYSLSSPTVLIHLVDSLIVGNPTASAPWPFLLDCHPESATQYYQAIKADLRDNPGLGLGDTFYDAERNISITNAGMGDGWAMIDVTLGTPPKLGLRKHPTLIVKPREGDHYNITVINNDPSDFPSSTFCLYVTRLYDGPEERDSDWTFTPNNFSLGRGQSQQVVATVGTNPTPYEDGMFYFYVFNRDLPFFFAEDIE